MPARCHQDSCSITWEEVNTLSGPAYKAHVDTDDGAPDVDATPTIRCGANGLEVIISGAAGNTIQSTGTGLFSRLPEAVVETLSGNPDNLGVSPSADLASPQSSATYEWTNDTGREALALVSGEFNFLYGILGPSHAYSYAAGTGQKAGRLDAGAYGSGATPLLSPYNAQLAMRLLANVNAPPTTSRKACRVDIGGMVFVSNASGAEQKVTRVPFFWMVRVPGGADLRMKSQAFYEGPSQTVNVAAAPGMGTGLAGTGHELWNLQVAAIPI